MSDANIQIHFPEFEIKHINNQRVILSKNLKKDVVLFIHGSPGSSIQFLLTDIPQRLINETNCSVVIIDRNGYGYSEFGLTDNISILASAESISKVIGNFKDVERISIIGYSYGGPIAAALALLLENKTTSLVLISASVKPSAEKIFWFSKIISHKYICKMIPKIWLVANIEKLNHENYLKEFEGNWAAIKPKIICLHGNKDKLILVENTDYVKENAINSKEIIIILIKDARHNILWDYPNRIFDALKANCFNYD
ncbi:MAG: alpha/beta hydrolase [Ferruginibacter sp.]